MRTFALIAALVVSSCLAGRAADVTDALDQTKLDQTHAVSVSAGGLHVDGGVACSTCSSGSRGSGGGGIQDVQLGAGMTIGHGLQPTLGTPKSARTGSAKAATSGGTLPAKFRSLKFTTVYESMGDAPLSEHVGGHVKAHLTPKTGVAIGFVTGTDGNEGHCSLVDSPAVDGDKTNCTYSSWISATPGGNPVMNKCLTESGSFDAEAVYYSASMSGAASGYCDLKPATKYYCNVAGCPGVVVGPLGVADYTQAQSNALNEQRVCDRHQGVDWHFHNGQCVGPDGATTPPADNRPKCSNEVMKLPAGNCVLCGTASPAACEGPTVNLVGNCETTCRP